MRAFITHTTENYEHITLNLVKSIKKYSNYDIIVYTIDYDGSDKLQKEATCKRLDLNLPKLDENGFINGVNGNTYVNRQQVRTYLTLGAKVDAMLDASSYIDEWVYIDSDSIANKNVDELFEYCNLITEFPLATLGPHEFVLIVKSDGTFIGNPFWKENGTIDYENTLEWPLMKFMGLEPNQRSHYRTTNILVGNTKVKDFLKTWKETKDILPKLVSLKDVLPYHEETIYNVLSWKINHTHAELPISYINVDGSSTLTHFFKTNVNERTVFKVFYTIPKDKNNIKVFHGEKRQSEIDKMFEIIDNTIQTKTKVLFLAPHLSTGGMPSFLLKRIESLLEYGKELELYVVEFSNHSDHYVVQKNKIKELIPQSNFWTLGEDKMDLVKIIEENEFDIIHLDEMIEAFDFHNPITPELMNYLYNNDRTWRMVETCHNIIFKPNLEKHFHPEAYAYCSPWHKENTFKEMPSYGEVLEFPIEDKIPTSTQKIDAKLKLGLDFNKKHILNVGLWTQGKNQKEGIKLARLIEKSNPEYVFHFVGNQAPNFQEYWEPIMKDLPSNVKIWGERNDVDLFLTAADIFMFNSTWECNPLVLREAISYGLPTLSRNLPQYMNMFTQYIHPIDDDINKTKNTLLSINNQLPNNQQLSTEGVKLFAEQHLNLYKKIMNEEFNKQKMMNSEIQVFQHFVNNPFLEIKGNTDKKYKVEFFDEKGINRYSNEISVNHWVKLNRSYYTKWRAKITSNDQTIYEETLDLTNKRVYISFDSKSLGDSVAWIPYVLEFKKKHNCTVIVSTFWNNLFEKTYPELEFIRPGVSVDNLNAMYNIGWYYNADREPEMPNTIPLQKTATNILGLDFEEIKPKISCNVGQSPYSQKYVTIATNSTSGCKFWTREYWQKLINHLNSLGYQVINVSKEDNPFDNASKIKDTSIENTMRVIHHSEFFIGLSSGLSWLSWGLGKHVVMISNFTEEDHEFTSNCTRIINKSVCNGCWNNPNFRFDKGDWNWCPVHKGTKRQFECHKSITPEMVINQIQHLLK
jgi:autotransporter strand-loop-strand O-heptosyltransferase